MKKPILILGNSDESKAAEELLIKNGIDFEKSFHDSPLVTPVLIDPKGRAPWRGLKEINGHINRAVALCLY